ncbi:hypothetical protein BKA70DRAFT_1218947 [Coprinopsis sp. MPI-PUGE-AT-0042]|nr:hypothetical protein BKA70DRAFT_1218947 [Coprinopsis sp. MPI-PUGE-AT-0042]
MTPQEFELRRILRIYYASQTCKNGVAAIQIFMWFYMLSQFMQATPSIRRSRAMYLGVSFILMALAVTIALVGSMDVFNTVFRALPTEPEPSFKIWLNGYKTLGYLGDLLGDISFFVADALLIYRCYVICFDFTWLATIPATIYLANLGLAISGYVKEEGWGDDRVDAATIFLLVFNNIILTCIISWRLLRGHRELSKSMPMVQHRLYTGAVAVLAESAAPMAVFGLGYGWRKRRGWILNSRASDGCGIGGGYQPKADRVDVFSQYCVSKHTFLHLETCRLTEGSHGNTTSQRLKPSPIQHMWGCCAKSFRDFAPAAGNFREAPYSQSSDFTHELS